MEDNIFDGIEEVDAEFMERWLGGAKINSLSPKTLYDIQMLIKHYSDIIVPDKKLSVEFPTEQDGCARASVANGQVIIPTNLLQEGRVDETIGCMIHELHHIKLSDSEKDIWLKCFVFVCKALDSLFIETEKGYYTSLKDVVLSDSSLSFADIMSDNPQNPNADFLRQACDDVAFLLNAVEDIRIDEKTPPNLKKYLDKQTDRIGKEFKEKYDEGDLDENNLMNIVFRLLFHHKDVIHDDFIDSRFGDKEFIVNSSPSEYTPVVFDAFKNELRNHIENLYQDSNNTVSNSEKQDEQGIDIMDMYLGDDIKESIEEQLKEHSQGDKNKAFSSCGEIEFDDKELGDGLVKFSQNSKKVSEEMIKVMKTKPPILPIQTILEIDSYARIKIHQTTECFDGKNVNYACVVYDDTK